MESLKTLYLKKLKPTNALETLYGLMGLFILVAFIVIPFLPDMYSPTENPSERYFTEHLLTITLEVICFCILGLGLNLVTGMTGLLELGYVLFVSIGAYTVALMYPAFFAFQVKHIYFLMFLGFAAFGIWTYLTNKKVKISTVFAVGVICVIISIAFNHWLQSKEMSDILFKTEGTPASVTSFVLFMIVLLFCGLHAAIWGVIRGIPVVKLTDDYFAIVTFAFYEIVLLIIKNEVWLTEGPKGINNFQPGLSYLHRMQDKSLFQNDQILYFIILLFLGLTILASYLIQNSRFGRALFALKADELSAKSCGINIPITRLTVFAVSGFVGGVGGALMATKIGIVSPNTFDFWVSVIVLCCLVLGGMGHIRGVIVGSIILISVQELLKDGIPIQMNPEELKSLTKGSWSIFQDKLYAVTAQGIELKIAPQARFFVFGIVMVLVMVFRPAGLIPRRGEDRELSSDEKEDILNHPCEKFHLSQPERLEDQEKYIEEPYILEIRELTKHFGGVHAVNAISEKIARGKITSLIGPNGAGKTTLFNMVTKLIDPTKGNIILHSNKETTEISDRLTDEITYLGIARTFQNIRLFQDLSVLENVKVGLHPQAKNWLWESIFPWLGMKEEMEVHRAAVKYLDFVGLLDFAHQTASSLSYGHQRKLEIARALASNPQLLLLDEPAAGMNPQETNELMELIRKIRTFGITIFLIEHDMSLVMEISDYIFVLDGGTKISAGNPATVKNDPLVIRAYLGDDNEEEEEKSSNTNQKAADATEDTNNAGEEKES